MPDALSRSTRTALIAFGSNQGDSLQVFKASLTALQKIASVTVVSHSEPIWTAPVTGQYTEKNDSEQPYLNAVIRIATELSPSELHLQTAAIEHQFGRVRSERWQDRAIDLDILLLGDQIVDTRSLTLPHPRMSFRRFVLEPAAEIAAEIEHPLAKCSIATLLKRINSPNKIMALVCSDAANQTAALDHLIDELTKLNFSWQFIKVFSAEKLLQLDSNITVVVTFDAPVGGSDLGNETDKKIQWTNLRSTAIRFTSPSLRLEALPSDPIALTELTAMIQTIG